MKAWDETWKTEEGRTPWLKPNPFVVSKLERFKKEGIKRVLDLGFGVGRHAVLFAGAGFDVYGIDRSRTGLEYTRKWAEREKVSIDLRTGDMCRLPFDSGFFDLILAWNVIYHGVSKDIVRGIQEIKRCLKPDGYFLFTLISTRHHSYGIGKEIEKNTWVMDGQEDKDYPHHYFNREEIDLYLGGFALLECVEKKQPKSQKYHWNILAKAAST
jgi:tellurite methyltransferase